MILEHEMFGPEGAGGPKLQWEAQPHASEQRGRREGGVRRHRKLLAAYRPATVRHVSGAAQVPVESFAPAGAAPQEFAAVLRASGSVNSTMRAVVRKITYRTAMVPPSVLFSFQPKQWMDTTVMTTMLSSSST